MNQETKTNWIKALESGKYPKGKRILLKNGSYCCLGVLAEITEELSISKNGVHCLKKGKDLGYRPFNVMLGEYNTNRLTDINDSTNTFKEVIEHIKTIPVTNQK